MTIATLGGALFTVAYGPFPKAMRADAACRKEFAAAVVGALYRHLGQAPLATLSVEGELFTVTGKSPDGDVVLRARVWLTDPSRVEGVVTAEQTRFPGPHADDSLRGVELSRSGWATSRLADRRLRLLGGHTSPNSGRTH